MTKFLSFLCIFSLLLTVPVTARAVSIDLVPVGNPGNENDPLTGCGRVDYSYQIGKFEITSGQYASFLNAVAKTDTYGLYNPYMGYAGDPAYGGCNIKRTGASGNYTYSVPADWANRPVYYVSWGDAARFVNWLANGQPTGAQNLSTTEDGSYYLNGAITNQALIAVTRKSNAKWFIPTSNEWYKAAYYDPNKPSGAGYWLYPTGTDNVPSNLLINPDPGNNANYNSGQQTLGPPYFTTNVGEFENSESPYGTYDQGGNIEEWNETAFPYAYGSRYISGGALNMEVDYMTSSFIGGGSATLEFAALGFRVAYIPEPSGMTLILAAVATLLLIWRKQLIG
jgi:sulfatase modifying factor 1